MKTFEEILRDNHDMWLEPEVEIEVKKYIVAIRTPYLEPQLFEFDDEGTRDEFMIDVKSNFPESEFVTSETERE